MKELRRSLRKELEKKKNPYIKYNNRKKNDDKRDI